MKPLSNLLIFTILTSVIALLAMMLYIDLLHADVHFYTLEMIYLVNPVFRFS